MEIAPNLDESQQISTNPNKSPPMTIWQFLTEPFTYEFVRRAFLSAVLVGGLCGLVGMYIVLRRMSYIGHGLSYALFGGAVFSVVIGINFYVGTTAWAFLSAMAIVWAGRRRTVGTDAAIGIITTVSFAFGVILLSAVDGFRTDFDAALFGNILSLNSADMWLVIAATIAITIAVFLAYKPLLFMTFDPDVAVVYGVSQRKMDILFSFIVAALLVASMRIVGVTLIAAGLIAPPTTARMLTNNFHRMMAIAILIGAVGGLVGVYASWYLDWATGGTIVATYGLLFVLVFTWSILTGRQ